MKGLAVAAFALWLAPVVAPFGAQAAPPSGENPVEQLRIAPEGPRSGYQRTLFPHWVDADGDGCNTREEVLVAESTVPAETDPARCTVLSGRWVSTYDGVTTDDPAGLQIDHVVALAEAWDSGAAGWDTTRRRAFANDLGEPAALIAVTGAANSAKSDRDPAEWRPPRPEAACDFARAWVTVKLRWDLSADEAEAGALRDMLASC
ncbi:MAG: HNH endonuclease family protein [Acidimicrobiia bacterium]